MNDLRKQSETVNAKDASSGHSSRNKRDACGTIEILKIF